MPSDVAILPKTPKLRLVQSVIYQSTIFKYKSDGWISIKNSRWNIVVKSNKTASYVYLKDK